jgi:hypothetical protein
MIGAYSSREFAEDGHACSDADANQSIVCTKRPAARSQQNPCGVADDTNRESDSRAVTAAGEIQAIELLLKRITEFAPVWDLPKLTGGDSLHDGVLRGRSCPVNRLVGQGIILAASLSALVIAILTFAHRYAPAGVKCANKWPMWIGCTMAAHENLAGGLIAAAGALFAAWVAWVAIGRKIQETLRHAEQSRRDNAERALTRYGIAILDVMDRYTQVFHPQDEKEVLARLDAFRAVMDDPTVRSAMVDSLFGRDQPMVAFFLNSARFAAYAYAYEHEGGEEKSYKNMVWPLYQALSAGINHRKAKLLEGATVDSLYDLSTIDDKEVRRAFMEERPPKLG